MPIDEGKKAQVEAARERAVAAQAARRAEGANRGVDCQHLLDSALKWYAMAVDETDPGVSQFVIGIGDLYWHDYTSAGC